MDLTSTSVLKSILSQHNLYPKKHLGQNFLVSRPVLQRFLEACELSKNDAVLEVGAGLGTVTVELVQHSQQVVAVEVDKHLFHLLNQNLKQQGVSDCRVKTFLGDILKYGIWTTAVNELPYFLRFKVVGSIPYQITSPLLHQILFGKKLPSLVCLIVQKEIAEKIVARSPRASYLSNFVGLFGGAEIVGKSIPSSAFWPQPKVRSTILRIKPVTPDPSGLGEINPQRFFGFLHRGFSHPRKMLRAVFKKEALQEAGIDPRLRPQELQLQDWLRLYKNLET